MKNILFSIILIALLWSFNETNAQDTYNAGKTTTDTNSQINVNLVENLANGFIKKTGIPGFSIAVSKNDKIIYAQGFGYANIKDKVKMTPDTRLRAASVSKLITTLALGHLLSQGKLDLDAPIKEYIPYIDAKYAHITTRQLAGHTSGFDHRPKGKRHKKRQFTSMKPMVELMDKPLLFDPDTDYKYSTHGFVVLGAVIEGASGIPFETYMKDVVFKPLGMTQTFPENIKELTTDDSEIYYLKKGKPRKEKWTNTSYNLPGAGFRSTPSDLLKMMRGYTNGFISKEIVTAMFRSHTLKNGEKTNVGITWRNSYDAFGHKTIEHAGNWLGARTVVVHYPEENMNVSIMLNVGGQILIEEMAHIFAELFRERPKTTPTVPNTNTPLGLTLRLNGEVAHYSGNIVLNDHKGMLHIDYDGFLKSSEFFYLGYENHYALITDYGVSYLNLTNKASLRGELYMYGTMNKIKPRENKAIASFKSL